MTDDRWKAALELVGIIGRDDAEQIVGELISRACDPKAMALHLSMLLARMQVAAAEAAFEEDD